MQTIDHSTQRSSGLMTDLLFRDETYKIIGAAMEVHKHLGCGYLEPVYQEALQHEFNLQGIPYKSQMPISISYKDVVLEKFYVADFVIFNQILVEIKAADALEPNAVAQMINYLKGTGSKLGILINFGAKSLEWKRIALTRK